MTMTWCRLASSLQRVNIIDLRRRRILQMTVLKPGHLVVLKSGGPVMTVDTVNTDVFDDDKITGVLCAWFVGNKLERARFDPGALVPAPSPDAQPEKVESHR